MISYKKLFDLLDKKKIKKVDLRTKYGVNPKTVDSLVKNKSVTVDTLCQLCEILDCQPGDIVDYIPDTITASDKPSDENLKDEDAIRQRISITGIYSDMCKKGVIENTDSDNVEHYIKMYAHSYYIIELLKHGVIERCHDGYKLITNTEADK